MSGVFKKKKKQKKTKMEQQSECEWLMNICWAWARPLALWLSEEEMHQKQFESVSLLELLERAQLRMMLFVPAPPRGNHSYANKAYWDLMNNINPRSK